MGQPTARKTRNDFVFEVNRIYEYSGEGYPMGDLQESQYSKTTDERQHDVGFSDDGEKVTINWLVQEPTELVLIGAQKVPYLENSIEYDIQDGYLPGGRFTVWITDSRFEAELTIYGSGVPISMSERGDLVPKDPKTGDKNQN